MATTPRGPLAGLHVPDLAWVLAGPYAAMLLGDLAIAGHPRADDC